MDISLVILTWNSERDIEKCIDSIVDSLSSKKLDFEIFVIDNGSTDSTVEKLNALRKQVQSLQVIYLDHNTGTTYSRNLGLQKATGDYIVIMDSDMEVNRETFSTLIAELETNPGAGIVAPRLTYGSGALQKSTDDFPTITRKIYRYFFLKKIEEQENRQEESFENRAADYAISAFWMFRRSLIADIGTLDENYFYAPEDVDFCIRTWKNNQSVLYVPKAHAIHYAQEISRGFKINKALIEHIKGLAYYFFKHRYIFRKPKFKIDYDSHNTLPQKRVRVLHLGSSSGLYGAEHWILALVNHLDSDRFENIVGAICDDVDTQAQLCQKADSAGFESITIQTGHKYALSAVSELRKIIVEKSVDIVHTHGYKTDLVALLASVGTGCKVLTTPHGWTQNPDFKLRLYEIMDRGLFHFMSAIAPLSEALYKPLRANPFIRSRVHYIKNAANLDEIEACDELADDIETLRQDGKFIIGYIGRLISGKGLDTLFHAVARLENPDIHIALIGEGEERESLGQLATTLGLEHQVSFFGFRDDRISYLNGFDIFVLPSLSEGIPRCLMESMAAGIPIVASDIPGCRNLVDGHSTGLLFEVSNSENLAKKIQLLHSDNEFRQRLSENAHTFVHREYSAQRMAGEYALLYDDLAG